MNAILKFICTCIYILFFLYETSGKKVSPNTIRQTDAKITHFYSMLFAYNKEIGGITSS